jgi:thimet oligopeptidase
VNHVRETDDKATAIESDDTTGSGPGLADEAWPPELHDHRSTTAADVAAIADAALAEADATVAAAISASRDDGATFAEVLGRIDQALGDLTEADGRSGFMVRVHPDAAVRAAGQAANQRMTTWRRSLPMRDDVAEAIERYARTADARTLSGEERRLLDHWQRDLRRAGHGLAPEARAELRDLTARAVALEAAFQRNVDEWSDGIDVTHDDLAGLPEDFVGCLGPGDAPGTLRVSLQNPDYYSFMEGSPRRGLREALRRKRVSRAVEINRPILEEVLELRRRYAAILGYASWADYRIEPKMARTPARVAAFHASIFPALRQLAAPEYAAMRARLEAETGSRDLQTWDTAYYDRKIRADEYDVDQDEVSAYLTLDAVIDGLLRLTQDVFGLRYREIADPRAWAPEVRLFEVQDAASGTRLGWFYLDLHPRPGKFQHAMAQPLALSRRGRDGVRRMGISAIVCNIPRPTAGAQPRLRHDDVEMLFHEFGHVLHEVIGTNGYYETSMERLEDDFPEAVSQIMENWAWEPEILARVSRHAETGAPMPTELAARQKASRNVNLGSHFIDTFAIYGDFDLRIHGPEPVDLDEAMAAAEALRELPPIDGSFWPASFVHIVGGYDAGYYGYLWSLVYGDDLWSRFLAEGIASPVAGAAYRREILEPGASRDAEVLVEAFLGRPSTNEAFLRRTGIGAVGATPQER